MLDESFCDFVFYLTMITIPIIYLNYFGANSGMLLFGMLFIALFTLINLYGLSYVVIFVNWISRNLGAKFFYEKFLENNIVFENNIVRDELESTTDDELDIVSDIISINDLDYDLDYDLKLDSDLVPSDNLNQIQTNCEKSNNSSYNRIINKFCEKYGKPVKVPYIIGICGGSGSGKTFIANLIDETVKKIFHTDSNSDSNSDLNSNVVVISQDSYYIGGNTDTNYDIPSSIDFDLLVSNLKKLIDGKSIQSPIYDFTTHSRRKETIKIDPGKIIIIEGILILTHEKLRNLLNMKIFVQADAPTQIFRRAERDINQRGRTIGEVSNRYIRDVWPAYKQYVLPSAQYADMSINNTNDCLVGPEIMLNHIITVYRSLNNN